VIHLELGAEEAFRASVKVQELAPVMIFRGASLKVQGKVYKACLKCVQRVIVHGSETWPVRS